MTTITLNPKVKSALIHAVSMNIDMLNDLAVEPMWMSPSDLRLLAQKDDAAIRAEMSKSSRAVYKNIDQLVALELLYSELTAE